MGAVWEKIHEAEHGSRQGEGNLAERPDPVLPVITDPFCMLLVQRLFSGPEAANAIAPTTHGLVGHTASPGIHAHV